MFSLNITYGASILKIETESQNYYTRTYVALDSTQNLTVQSCDRMKEDGYFYLDVYDITTQYLQRVINVSDPSVLRIEAVPYVNHGVMRFVFYVRNREATTFAIRQNPGRIIVDVVIPAGTQIGAGNLPIGRNQTSLIQIAGDNAPTSSSILYGKSGVKEFILPDLPRYRGAKSMGLPVGPDKKRLIIIDPGHGGNAPGAESSVLGRRANEKDINLQFAYALKRCIDRTPNLTAIMTRTNDSALTLSDRVKYAESQQGSLFISIHMNHADNPDAKGVEIYFLSEKGTAQANLELERKENAEVGNLNYFDTKRATVLNNIFSGLKKEERDFWQNESYEACERLLSGMMQIPYLRFNNRGLKSANFYVLKNSKMPSVLLEVGFMSNREDMANIIDPEFQEKTATALTRAIVDYFKKTETKY